VGQAYVLYGVAGAGEAAAAWPTDSTAKGIVQTTTPAKRGRVVDGFANNTWLGEIVTIVGDVNKDGYDDIAISSVDWNGLQGRVWLVWGKPRAEAATPLYVNTPDASEFVEITGEAIANYFGQTLAGGDFNHDGFSDLLISAVGYSNFTGRSYIVWGHNGTWPDKFNAIDIGETVDGVKITGEAGSYSGNNVANAGDVNHDGKTDLIIGTPGASPSSRMYAGCAYIVFGKDSRTWPTINLDSFTSADGIIINGAAAGSYLGFGVSGNVDVNGDNTADVIMSANYATPDAMRINAGITYVMFGSATLPAIIETSTFFDGTKGFKLLGEKTNDYSGWPVSGASDVNGDRIGDIIIGAYQWDQDIITADAGRSYVVFGHRGAWPAAVELSTLNGKNGFTISGNYNDE
jgi:glycosylphosphatidylinositol phospholipase D